jgi:hypothetical protein
MLDGERLAYWYLRLNGFLLLPNVMIHPEVGRNPMGEIDVLGVRFPHRRELLTNSMEDDRPFTQFKKPLIVLGEVAKGQTKVNASWRDRSKRNIDRMMRLVGAFPPVKEGKVISALYDEGFYSDETYNVSVVCFGQRINSVLAKELPKVIHVTWMEVVDFIFRRFEAHEKAKHYHRQWDEVGHQLWSLYQVHRIDRGGFGQAVRTKFGLLSELDSRLD